MPNLSVQEKNAPEEKVVSKPPADGMRRMLAKCGKLSDLKVKIQQQYILENRIILQTDNFCDRAVRKYCQRAFISNVIVYN